MKLTMLDRSVICADCRVREFQVKLPTQRVTAIAKVLPGNAEGLV